MARISYDQARADHEYLWRTYAPASDMTGGYVDQDDLQRLLESPTKKTATGCYVNQISHWFAVGPEGGETRWRQDPRVLDIAIRHGKDDDIAWVGAAAAELAAIDAED